MKKIAFLLIFLSLQSCDSQNNVSTIEKEIDIAKYANTITSEDLKEALYTYASDEFEGRRTGEPGQKKAVEFIKEFYLKNDIPSPLGDTDYFQEI